MDLKALRSDLPGRALGVGGRVYSSWDGDVLRDVPANDARELLSLKGYFRPEKNPPKDASPSGSGAREPGSAPDGGGAGGSPPDGGTAPNPDPNVDPDNDQDYTAEELEQFTVSQLLEFVPESQHAAVRSLRKAELIEYILELHSGEGSA